MRRVLLLNVTYEPLTTVGLRRAVCLVLCGKAEVVHDDVAGAVLLARVAPGVEPPDAAPGRRGDIPHLEELGDPGGEMLAQREFRTFGAVIPQAADGSRK